MNLVQLSNELEYLPKDRLAEMAQDPSSMYPPYLVLAEIQRRTQMEKMYAAAQPRPQTTVAEEVVNEFAMTNPNAGISSMTGSAPTDRFSPESKDMPAPMTMQTAASGGLTGYQNRGQTMIEQSLANPQERGLFGRGLDYIKENPGSAALNAATLGLAFVPGIGAGLLGYRAFQAARALNYARGAKKAADLAKKGAQATYSRPNPIFSNLQQGTRRVLQKDGTYKVINTATGKAINPRVVSLKRAVPTSIAGMAGLQGINYAMQDDEKVNTQMMPDRELTTEEKELLRLQNEAATAETKPERKGLDDSALDLVGLGGLIMGARNVSDLGKGISDFATAKQAARGNQAQQDYYAASAEKTRAEIEGLPLENKMEALEQVNDILTKATEGEIKLTEKELIYYNTASKTLTDQILSLQGIDLNTQASFDKNLIASFGT